MKSYNQFMCEVYDLQESGQIELSENPFKGMLTKFSQSPVGSTLNKAYSAVKDNPVVTKIRGSRITRGLGRAAPLVHGAANFAQRRERGQSMTRSAVGSGIETAAGWKAAGALGTKSAAACSLGGPIAAAGCGIAGAGVGYYLGSTAAKEVLKRTGAGAAMDKHDPIGDGLRSITPPPSKKGGGKNK